jgi:hypothetical protein
MVLPIIRGESYVARIGKSMKEAELMAPRRDYWHNHPHYAQNPSMSENGQVKTGAVRRLF